MIKYIINQRTDFKRMTAYTTTKTSLIQAPDNRKGLEHSSLILDVSLFLTNTTDIDVLLMKFVTHFFPSECKNINRVRGVRASRVFSRAFIFL